MSADLDTAALRARWTGHLDALQNGPYVSLKTQREEFATALALLDRIDADAGVIEILQSELAKVAVAVGRSTTDGHDCDWAFLGEEVGRLSALLKEAGEAMSQQLAVMLNAQTVFLRAVDAAIHMVRSGEEFGQKHEDMMRAIVDQWCSQANQAEAVTVATLAKIRRPCDA